MQTAYNLCLANEWCIDPLGQLYLALFLAFLTGAAFGFCCPYLFRKLSDHRLRRPNRDSARRQAGNVFFMLFGAVALVGVIGASSMTIMKGPVKSMAMVTKRTIAENNMIAAGKLALIAATNQEDGGNCDADSYIEPVPFSESGSGPMPAGGGYLPAQIGASLQDPWGNTYGYCTWDHGPEINTGDCTDENRLAGVADGQGIAIAVISSGPDRSFQTACSDHPNYVFKAPGSDDIVLQYTYQEAQALSAGLWNIKEGEPETAEIAKNIEIEGAVRFGIAGEDPGQVGIAACSGPSHINHMRYNPFGKQIEVCLIEDENYLWRPLSGGSGVPLGTIAPFDSAECPAGWEEVAELAGRTIMGVGGGYSLGDTGGAATVTLTGAQMPSHTHQVDPPSTDTNSAGSHRHSSSTYLRPSYDHTGGGLNYGQDSSTGSGPNTHTNYAGAHDHSVDIAAFSSSTAGSNSAHENRPPYRVFTFCRHVEADDGGVEGGNDTLAGLECETGELPKWDGEDWVCASDSNSDTLEALDCEANEYSRWNGSAWECAAISDSDTLAGLDCEVDQIAKWNSSAWACGDENDIWILDGSDIYYDTGNVGIGTGQPTNKLHVVGGHFLLDNSDDEGSDGGNTHFNFLTHRVNDQGLQTGGPNKGWGFFARGENYTGSGGNQANDFGLSFHDGSGWQNHLFIEHDTGNVGIGTTEPTYPFEVSASRSGYIAKFTNTDTSFGTDGVMIQVGQTSNPTTSAHWIRFMDGDGTMLGSIRGDGAGGIETSGFTSDRRAKTDIEPTEKGIDDVMRLHVVDYKMKATGQHQTGFIAQDVYKIFPWGIQPPEPNTEQMWNMHYGRITPLLTKGIQDLKRENDELRDELTAMRSDNDSLRTLIEEQGREIEALQADTQ